MAKNPTPPPKQVSARQRRSKETISRILTHAEAIIASEGLSVLTMRRLAQDAGIGTGTIYGHFRTRDDLIKAVYNERLNHKLDLASTTLLAPSKSPEEALLAYFSTALEENHLGPLDRALFARRQETPVILGIVEAFERGLYERYLAFLTRHATSRDVDELSATAKFNLALEYSLLQTEVGANQTELATLQKLHAGTLGLFIRRLGIDLSPSFEARLCALFDIDYD
jgi:AcrR family transcriptional regulator